MERGAGAWADLGGAPYLPVGAVFVPLSWTGAGGEEDWAKDKAALDLLGKSGVHDLVLSAGAKGLTHVAPAAAQRVLDYLDANGFHYGLRIADFPQDPLIGYVVKPAVYRTASPSASGPTRFRTYSQPGGCVLCAGVAQRRRDRGQRRGPGHGRRDGAGDAQGPGDG